MAVSAAEDVSIARQSCVDRYFSGQLAPFHGASLFLAAWYISIVTRYGTLSSNAGYQVQRVSIEEWGGSLIRSWNSTDWFTKPRAVGDVVAPTLGRFRGGNLQLLSTAGMETILHMSPDVNMAKVPKTGLALADLFVALVSGDHAEHFGGDVMAPSDHARRVSQLVLCGFSGYSITQTLIDGGLIVDLRAPDLIRLRIHRSTI